MTAVRQPNRALIERLVETGLSADEATWAVERVLAAVPDVLRAGRTVRIEDTGTLSMSKPKAVKCVRPSELGMVRQRRQVRLSHPATLDEGEPYTPIAEPARRAIRFNLGGLQ